MPQHFVESNHVVFTFAQPYAKTVDLLRRCLLAGGFAIGHDWDVAGELRRQFGVELVPCRVLYVYSPHKLLENIVMDTVSAIAAQVPLAVCERQGHAHVILQFRPGETAQGLRDALQQAGASQVPRVA